MFPNYCSQAAITTAHGAAQNGRECDTVQAAEPAKEEGTGQHTPSMLPAGAHSAIWDQGSVAALQTARAMLSDGNHDGPDRTNMEFSF